MGMNIGIISKKRPELTSALVELICEAIGRGLKFEESCALVGLSKNATSRLLKDAQLVYDDKPESYQLDEVYRAIIVELIAKLPQAQAKFIDTHLTNIQRHSLTQWKASQYLLQITDPARFNPESAARQKQSDSNLLTASSEVIRVEELSETELLKIIEGEIVTDNNPSKGLEVLVEEYDNS